MFSKEVETVCNTYVIASGVLLDSMHTQICMFIYDIPANICTHLYIGGNSVQHLRYFLRRPRRHDHTTRSSCNQSRFFPFFLEGFSISFFLSPFIYILVCSHLYTSVYIYTCILQAYTSTCVFVQQHNQRFFSLCKGFSICFFCLLFGFSLPSLCLFFSFLLFFSFSLYSGTVERLSVSSLYNTTLLVLHPVSTGWRSCIGCFKLQVSFFKRVTNYRALLRKMTWHPTSLPKRCTPHPSWGDIFESSKLKARTSLLPRCSEKRRSSFEL